MYITTHVLLSNLTSHHDHHVGVKCPEIKLDLMRLYCFYHLLLRFSSVSWEIARKIARKQEKKKARQEEAKQRL